MDWWQPQGSELQQPPATHQPGSVANVRAISIGPLQLLSNVFIFLLPENIYEPEIERERESKIFPLL